MAYLIIICLLFSVAIAGMEIRFRKNNANGRGKQYADLMLYTKSYEFRHQKRLERVLKIKSNIDQFSNLDYNRL